MKDLLKEIQRYESIGKSGKVMKYYEFTYEQMQLFK